MRADHPQLVGLRRRQRPHAPRGDDRGLLVRGDDDHDRPAHAGPLGLDPRVRRGDDPADRGAGGRGAAGLVPDHGLGDAEGDHDHQAGGGERGGQPRDPHAALRVAPGRVLGEQPRDPGPAAVQADPLADGRRELAGPVGGSQHPPPELRRRVEGLGQAEPGRGLAQAADLVLAQRAVLEMTLEAVPLGLAERVEDVAAAQHVQVVTHDLHHSTSRQSRILISPSRIRVLTVPRATPSSRATCG